MLSIQQKFRFYIWEIPCAQWNGTFRLYKPDPSHHFSNGYCTCKQDSKQWYWGQQFCQIERDILVRLTEMTRPVKEDDLQSWSRIFQSDQTQMVRSIKWKFPEFWFEWKALMALPMPEFVISNNFVVPFIMILLSFVPLGILGVHG